MAIAQTQAAVSRFALCCPSVALFIFTCIRACVLLFYCIQYFTSMPLPHCAARCCTTHAVSFLLNSGSHFTRTKCKPPCCYNLEPKLEFGSEEIVPVHSLYFHSFDENTSGSICSKCSTKTINDCSPDSGVIHSFL